MPDHVWPERHGVRTRHHLLADFTIDPPDVFDVADAEPGKQDPAEVAAEFRRLFPGEEGTGG